MIRDQRCDRSMDRTAVFWGFQILAGLCLMVGGCRSLESIDSGDLNHRAMDLQSRSTPARSSYLTGLGTTNTSSVGGSCAVCAH
jgi:hypothetical protein